MFKKFIAVLTFISITTASYSQFYKSLLPSPEFTSALEKIILDFRADYRNIQGALIDKGAVDVFESTIKLPGTDDCKILRFHSAKDTTAAWQAIVYNGDDYNEAVKAYQNTFRLVKKSSIKWIDRSSVSFSGQLETPRESVRFTTSTLTLQLEDKRYEHFEAQVELLSTFDGFEVHLNLHKKVKENPFDKMNLN